MKKVIIFLLSGFLLFSSCKTLDNTNSSSSNTTYETLDVAISLPYSMRALEDGDYFKEQLEKAGYTYSIEYAKGKLYSDEQINNQIAQIEELISQRPKILIILPSNGYEIADSIKTAKENNILVISYDRLVLNYSDVSFYITWNNEQIGKLQAQYLLEKLSISSHSPSNPIYMEFFTGDIEDWNVPSYFYGAMKVLEPYINSGTIVCPSGQTSIYECATAEWKTENARKRMAQLISNNSYSPKGKKLDAVLCSNDSTAVGVTEALKEAGYTAVNFPLITGQDCDISSIKNIREGTQSMSVLREVKTMSSKTMEIINTYLLFGKLPYNAVTRNGENSIPTYLCDSIYVDKNNWKEKLVDTGRYSIDVLQ